MVIANPQKTVKIFLNAFVGFEEYATVIRSFLLAFRSLQILNTDTVVTLLLFSSSFCKLHERMYHLSCLLLFLQHHLQCLAHSRCPNNWINECMNEKTQMSYLLTTVLSSTFGIANYYLWQILGSVIFLYTSCSFLEDVNNHFLLTKLIMLINFMKRRSIVTTQHSPKSTFHPPLKVISFGRIVYWKGLIKTLVIIGIKHRLQFSTVLTVGNAKIRGYSVKIMKKNW